VYKGVAVPLLWKLLIKKDDPDAGKKGSPNTEERKYLIEHFIRLFGKERIESVSADREFIGNDWFAWLKANNINIVIRIRENQEVTNSRGLYAPAFSLFRNLKPGESRILKGIRKIGEADVFIGGMKCPDGEFLIIVTFCNHEKIFEIYAKRWQIETMFACLKTRRFRFESTRLRDCERINRLLSITVMAFVWAYLTGEINENKKQTVIKKHGYRAKSIFRNGFDHLRRIFLNMNEYTDEFTKVTKIFSVPAVYFFKFHQLCDLK
ncbi:MAG: IS4 family transposase, partial [Desulfococcaceae bacterium]